MNCEKIQDAMFDALAGTPLDIPAEEVRHHVEMCWDCHSAIPEVAEDWVAINRAMMPEPTEDFWRRIDERVLSLAQGHP